MFRRIFTIYLCLFILIYGASVNGAEIKWKKYRSGELLLYFPDTFSYDVIPYLVRQTELSRLHLRSLYDWELSSPLTIVFDRQHDIANGWARSYLSNKVYLYIYPPDEFSTLANYKSFERNLILHEFNHAFQITITAGLPRLVNYVFGDLWYPEALMPGWLLEGGSIYAEASLDETGRLSFPLYQAYFNSFFENKDVYSLGQISGEVDDWMGPQLDYLYGAFFYDYMAEQFGLTKLKAFFLESGSTVIPFLIDLDAEKTLGSPFWKIYPQFIDAYEKTQNFESFIRPEAAWLSPERFFSVVVGSGTEDYLLMGKKIGERKIYRLHNTSIESLIAVPDIHSFTRRNSTYCMAAAYSTDDLFSYNELFVIEEGSEDARKITVDESASYPLFLDDTRIFYVSYKKGIVTLKIITKTGIELSSKSLPLFDSILSADISPDKKIIVFTGNTKDHDKDVFFYDLASGQITELLLPGNQYSVSFTDKDTVIFSTDKENMMIPAQYDIRNGSLAYLQGYGQITLYPRVCGKELCAIAFDNDGYFPVIFPYTIKAEEQVHPPVMAVQDMEIKRLPEVVLDEAYWWEGLAPSTLSPSLSLSLDQQNIGFSLMAEGNTNERSWTLNGNKLFGGNNFWELNLLYWDKALLPNFSTTLDWYFSDKIFTNKNKEQYKGSFQAVRGTAAFAHNLQYLKQLSSRRLVMYGHVFGLSGGFDFRQDILYSSAKQSTLPLNNAPDSVRLYTGFTYQFSFSFAPDSYLLTSPMNVFQIKVPYLLGADMSTTKGYFSLNPSILFSILLDQSGKIGFITRQNVYSVLVGDDTLSIGGEESSYNILSLDAFMFGADRPAATVRGYPQDILTANLVYFSNNEFRFHIVSLNWGWGLLPIMIQNLQGAVFVDAGTGADIPRLVNKGFLLSTGVELKLLTNWWYNVPLLLTAGFARGLTKDGINSVYFGIGNSF